MLQKQNKRILQSPKIQAILIQTNTKQRRCDSGFRSDDGGSVENA
jgi:hypothetical protein